MVAMALPLILHLANSLPHLILHVFNLVQFSLWPKCWMEEHNLLQGLYEPVAAWLIHLHLHVRVPQVQNYRSNSQILQRKVPLLSIHKQVPGFYLQYSGSTGFHISYSEMLKL